MSKAKVRPRVVGKRVPKPEAKVLRLTDLRPAPYNPRTITPEAVKALGTSLESFGDISGIVWNRTTGNLVCGHQRLSALKAQHGDGLRMEGDVLVTPDGERFPVRVVDWPESKERLANIAANNPHVAGEFDDAELAKVLDELAASEPAMFEALRFEDLRYKFPDDADGKEFDETAADDVKFVVCPKCGERFPA